MPSQTPKQARFMAAVAHGWKPTQEGVKAPPLKVAQEFNKADKGSKMLKRKKLQGGGLTGALQEYGARRRTAPQGIMGTGYPGSVPGGRTAPDSGFPPGHARIPRNGANGALGLATGFPGVARRPQGAGAGPNGSRGRGITPGPGNALLRTADTAMAGAGDQLGRLQRGLEGTMRPGTVQRQQPERGGLQRRMPMGNRRVQFQRGGKVEALRRLGDKLDDLMAREGPSAEVDALTSQIEELEPGAVERMLRSTNRGQASRAAVSSKGLPGRQGYQLGLTGEDLSEAGIRKEIEQYLVDGHWPQEDAREMATQFDIDLEGLEAFDPEGGVPNRVNIEADEELMDAFITAAEAT